MKYRLPRVFTPKTQAFVGITVWITAWTLIMSAYLGAGHHPVFTPHPLRLTEWDVLSPLLPWTIWPYSSAYVLVFVAFLMQEDDEKAHRLLYSSLALGLISNLVFWIYPTLYPRELFPLPQGTEPWTAFAFTILRSADSSLNCAPSMHVSATFLSALSFWKGKSPEKFWGFLIWAVVIAVSTLTTKQHYVIDVVTGILLAIAIYNRVYCRMTIKG